MEEDAKRHRHRDNEQARFFMEITRVKIWSDVFFLSFLSCPVFSCLAALSSPYLIIYTAQFISRFRNELSSTQYCHSQVFTVRSTVILPFMSLSH
jgi:hypothetical protein